MTAPTPASPATSLPRLLLLLSATTGLVDAASVLGLGKVFTANMTGNVVFLGFAAAGTPGFKVGPSLLALATFMLGAWGAGYLARAHTERPLRRWLMWAAMVETGLLWIAALIALGIDVTAQAPQLGVLSVIALTGFAMGLRNATVRSLKVPDLTTTVLTLTITGIAADRSGTNLVRRFAAVLSIFAGAAVGALLLFHGGLALPLALAGAIVVGATLLFARDPGSALPHRP
ncbi:YoaK family protein [Novosphingobium sp. AP12]|uniref:YoaK family protein n=1 Tax=Novosphingobium sp. AP12 TaxID=1144305 RepID=UPI000271F191|nr:YoaK family protein [Novosphingobium sp. AP12]EJL26435.1 putative membrane protein [Novosphingobium sp. AP12]